MTTRIQTSAHAIPGGLRTALLVVSALLVLGACDAQRQYAPCCVGIFLRYLQDERATHASMPVGPSAQLRIHLKPWDFTDNPHGDLTAY
mgnify:CR=1 FL=1